MSMIALPKTPMPPPTSTGAEKTTLQSTGAESFSAWNDADSTPNSPRMSMIAHPKTQPTPAPPPYVAKLNEAQAKHAQHIELLSSHRRQLRRKTTLKTQQRRRAQELLRHTKGLRKTELFKEYSDESLRKIIESMELKTFKDGEDIVTEKQPGNAFMVIMKGSAEVFKEGHEGKINTLHANDMLGEASLMAAYYLRSATVRAVGGEVHTLVLTREEYLALKAAALIEQKTEEGLRRASMSLVTADEARDDSGRKSTPPAPPLAPLVFSE